GAGEPHSGVYEKDEQDEKYEQKEANPAVRGADATVGPDQISADPEPAPDLGAAGDPSRRELFHGALNLGLLGLSAAGSSYGYFQATQIPEVRRVDVPIEG